MEGIHQVGAGKSSPPKAMTKATVLPNNYLKCLSAKDRKALGKAGLTAEEAIAAYEAKSERELQRQIVSLLRLKGIEPIVSRMDKRTSNNIGTPDILFAVIGSYRASDTACAWEVKLPGRDLSEDQERMKIRMTEPP